MKYTTVTTKGQVVIPEEIRRELNIKPGVKILVSAKNGVITMKIDNYQSKLNSFRSRIKKHLTSKKIKEFSLEEINSAKNQLWKTRNQK